MSTQLIILGIGVGLAAMVLWQKFALSSGCTDLNGEELRTLLNEQKNTIILDVRTPGEYIQGHIPSALSRPLDDIDKWAAEFKCDQSLYLLCASGMRSKTAAKILAQKGFTNLFNIRGGMGGWRGPVK